MLKRLPLVALALIFVVVQTAAVFLAPLLLPQFTAFPNPNDPVNPFIYIFLVLIVTAILLILIRMGRKRVIQGILYVSIFITMLYVFMPLLLLVDPQGYIALIGSLALSGLLIFLLAKSGEWYVIDAIGLIIAVGVTAILGMSLGILPVFILLIIMAVYDAISVYKTKHMIALAEGVTPLRLPVLFVVPRDRGFTMDKIEQRGTIVPKENEEREAFFMGLGDTVIPGLLVVSASIYLPAAQSILITANYWAAIGAMVGGLAGYLLLMRFVLKGKPQAGLPFLNTGAILGYLAAYLLAYGTIGPAAVGL